MTATLNNADNQTFENIKNIKQFSIQTSRTLAEQIEFAKKQIRDVEKQIEAKRSLFIAQKQEADRIEKEKEREKAPQDSVEQPPKPVQVKAPEKVVEVPVVAEIVKQPEEPVAPEKVAEPVVTEKPKVESKPKVEVKPQVEQKPKAQEQPAAMREISSVVKADGIIEKTFVDEKGNIKIRRFVDRHFSDNARSATTAPRPTGPRAPGDRGTRPPYQGNAPRQGDRPARPTQSGQNGYQGRPNGTRPPYATNKDGDDTRNRQQPQARKPLGATMPLPKPPATKDKTFGNKNKTHEKPVEDKKTASKKTLITRTYAPGMDDDDDRVVRGRRVKKTAQKSSANVMVIDHAVITSQEVSIKVLSEKIGKPVTEIIKKLFMEGITKSINDKIEFAVAEYVADSFGVKLELKIDKTAEETMLANEFEDNLPDDTKRPPIVTVMGHVDHGKTSLLDAIRKTNVTAGEAGGITQHIGAYTVTINGEQITFIDTPGHAAFTKMRARGAKVTDVAIIVVAADDGVMPQTIEAISHAKAAEVSIIVAINKMDKRGANPDAVKTQLTEYGLVAEEWGGDTIMVPVSAKSREGITELLEAILTVSEVKELRANPKKRAVGTIIEAEIDKGRGTVATVLVRNGTLKVGDSILAGTVTGKVRAMFDDKGNAIRQAAPSCPAEVLGFSEVPKAGDFVYAADDKLIRKVLEERKSKAKDEFDNANSNINLRDLFGRIKEGELKVLNIVVKTDVQGSLEAIIPSFKELSTDEVKVNPIHCGVGAINETDVMLAQASRAIVIGFNVGVEVLARANAEREGVEIKQYSIIYEALDEVGKAMKGLLGPQYEEVIIGKATVRKVFNLSTYGKIAGSYINSGKVTRNAKVRIYRGKDVVFNGNISSVRREKDDVKEVAAGYECGISLENFGDFLEEDVFEIYQLVEKES